jgi:cytosine/adenosine deaminase-related metal-dependent hydrolase
MSRPPAPGFLASQVRRRRIGTCLYWAFGAPTIDGHASLGWPDAGEIVPGALADLVTVALDSTRLAGVSAGTALESVVFAATAADVRDVVIGGRDTVSGGRHLLIDDVPAALSAAIRAVLP